MRELVISDETLTARLLSDPFHAGLAKYGPTSMSDVFHGITAFRMDRHNRTFRILLDDEIWSMSTSGKQEMIGRVSENPNEDLSGNGTLVPTLSNLPNAIQAMIGARIDVPESEECCKIPNLCPDCSDRMMSYFEEEGQVSRRLTDQ